MLAAQLCAWILGNRRSDESSRLKLVLQFMLDQVYLSTRSLQFKTLCSMSVVVLDFLRAAKALESWMQPICEASSISQIHLGQDGGGKMFALSYPCRSVMFSRCPVAQIAVRVNRGRVLLSESPHLGREQWWIVFKTWYAEQAVAEAAATSSSNQRLFQQNATQL